MSGRREYQQFEESEEDPFEEAAGYKGLYNFIETTFQTQYAPSQPDVAAEEETEEEAEELTRAETTVQAEEVGAQVEEAPILLMAIVVVIASIPAPTTLESVVKAPVRAEMALPPIHSPISSTPEPTPTLAIVATGASSQVSAMMPTIEETSLSPATRMRKMVVNQTVVSF
ncbi:uncharacterized protein A4U43_C02F7570 [Asparagus officinalis]|uniref:Uncharacterized protein n=1 Tax=Asparagus officinalis TaxID=4686 RepID=A0A5P1FHJ4_ASPOF|nr:uncharacterized protein A4U43_C02F7570 [Asparagus officinalis]